MSRRVVLSFVALLATTPVTAQDRTSEAASRNGIFVVGSLHRLHDSIPGFGFPALADLIERIAPRVMVLEVRPSELRLRRETPGRPEYPRVVWPLLERRAITAIAMEPDGDLFDRLTSRAKALADGFVDTSDAPFWIGYQAAFVKTLGSYWKGPAEVHDGVTADMSRGFLRLQAAVLGAALDSVQSDWDAFMIARVMEAARAHPDQRVLVLASYRNRHRFVEALRAREGERVVAMHEWIAKSLAANTVNP